MEKEKKEKKDKQRAEEKAEPKPSTVQKESVTVDKEQYSKLLADAEKSKEYWDRILRLQAEFENAKKRLEKERTEFIKFANEDLILELLAVLDDLERTVEAAQRKQEDFQAFLKGIGMILAHLYEMLKNKGVAPIEAKGKPFDPNFHEALLRVETDDFPEDTVVEELQKGYLLNERVIRTAKVKVSKKSANKDEAESSQ